MMLRSPLPKRSGARVSRRALRPLLSLLLVAGLTSSGCSQKVTGPDPSVESPTKGQPLPVDPGIICQEQNPADGTLVTINGQNMAPVPVDLPDHPKVALPSVTLVKQTTLGGDPETGASIKYGSEPGQTNASLLSWESQSKMAFRVKDELTLGDGSQGMLPAGVYDVQITNPNKKKTTSMGALAVAPRPTVADVSPGLVCVADQSKTITVTGKTVLRIGDNQAVVRIGGKDFQVASTSGCTPVAQAGLDAEFCDTVTVTIDQGALDSGYHDVVIANPETASCESDPSADGVKLRVVDAPQITSVNPAQVCSTELPKEVTLVGTGFLKIDGQGPTVTVNGVDVTVSNVGGTCDDLEVQGASNVKSCTEVTVQLPDDPAISGSATTTVTLTNPGDADCSGSTTTALSVAGPPTITDAQPSEICSDQPESITVTGTGFSSGATVTVGDTQATSVTVNGDGTELTAQFDQGIPAGTYDVSVENAPGCGDTLQAAITVDPTPLVFFVDPPVVYNGISVEATIFTTGLDAAASSVELVASDGTATALTNVRSPTRFNRILGTIPSGLAPGTYDIRVTSAIGCAGTLQGAVTITDSTNINISAVEPAFVSPTTATGITIRADANSTAKFEATPRAYLNPNPAQAGSVATALRAVEFQDDQTLSAVVPGGLNPGQYDLIVVNPGGDVGVLTQGVTVTSQEPPTITGVQPGSFDAGATTSATVFGENFQSGATVSFTCDLGGTKSTPPVTTNTVNPTSIDFSVDMGSVGSGNVCLVTVTNPDGASFTFSAVSVKAPSQNLFPSTTANSMQEARRGLGLEAGRPTATSRFLYAIGGDDGTKANAKTSVESARVGVFGALGTWSDQRYSLPQARTLTSSAIIGRYIYLVGGSDGTSPTSTVYRAQILDPLAGPEVTDLDAALGDGTTGLGGGMWYYKVAATFPNTDPDNPGGESLPGELLTVQLPDRADKIELTLTWQQVPGASGYRIYRTAAADGDSNDVQLLAEVNDGATTTYTDDGQTATTAGEVPLPPGSLGQWRDLTGSAMNTVRADLATAVVQNPNDPTQYYLYAFGGRDASGTVLDSYEWARVDVAADGSQTVSAWTTGSRTIGTAKEDPVAWVVTNRESNDVGANEAYVFVGTGFGSNGQATGEITSGHLGSTSTDGDLLAAGANTLDTENGLSSGRGGAVGAAANGFLFIMGGAKSALSGNDQSTNITAGPDLDNWNALGDGTLQVRRVYPALAQESAFFFVAGGADGSGNALDVVEQTVK